MDQGEVRNYYEGLVYDEIRRTLVDAGRISSDDMALDIACLALNELPPRYVRYSIDTAFYMEEGERRRMLADVSAAVARAHDTVRAKPRRY